MQYKRSGKSLKDIAKALNVEAVLEGSVQRSGDRVRISADLVHVATDRHVWVESYERDVRDVLALQNEVARTIAREVQIQLSPQEQAGFATAAAQRPMNPAAQEAYLQGRFYWNRRTSEGLLRALEFFRQATTIDPQFAPAFAGLADTYNLLPGGMATAVAYPLAKAAANRALAMDPTLADAHTSLAFAMFIFDRDWAASEAAFKRALQYNPGYATAHHWYGEYLSAMGRFDEAFAELEHARALDPLSTGIRTSIGSTYYVARRYDDAIRELRASLEIDPVQPWTYANIAFSYEQKGMLSEAAAETRQGLQAALGGAGAPRGARRPSRRGACHCRPHRRDAEGRTFPVGRARRDLYRDRRHRSRLRDVEPRRTRRRSPPAVGRTRSRVGRTTLRRAARRDARSPRTLALTAQSSLDSSIRAQYTHASLIRTVR
jgi:tetratricopeptide (TPR) repeat protein